MFSLTVCIVLSAESQKKKQQDDSDEYEDDESAASTSFQPQQVQPQQGYIPPMAQPGLPPVPGAPGMPPGEWVCSVRALLKTS